MEDILTAEQREKRDRRFAQDRAFREMNDEDAVKLARDLQRRSRQEQSADYAQKSTTGGAATIETARLLRERPTTSDPKLFMVRCKPGEEKALVIKLYNKYIQNKTRKPELMEAMPTSRWATAVAPGAELEIYSILAPGASGYIYVEAKREDNVKAALRGVLGVYASHTSVVPLDEMQDVVRVELRKEAIRKDDYVRMRGPFPYKGDLAKVHSVLEGGNRITVKLVPRIDMQRVSLNLDKNAPKGVPPPAKHFNADEIRALGGTISREQHDGEMMDNFDDHFFENGLLFLGSSWK
jgi:transcription elongation factor SPT5